MHNKIEQLAKEAIYSHLSSFQQQWLADRQTVLSFQQLRQSMIMMLDLNAWQLSNFLPDNYKALEDFYNQSRSEPLKAEPNRLTNAVEIARQAFPPSILGLCPVNSPKTRCCQLQTLDSAQGCGFACAYCAIPTFYGGLGKVRLPDNLEERLSKLELDPDKNYHIGTGQASDSLLYCDESMADALITLARRYPDNLILELKSKAKLPSFFLQKEIPSNMVFTWSLNPQEVINAWEGGTASLRERLDAAKMMAQKGISIGFHLHPIIPFEHYQQAYKELVYTILQEFMPEQILMISLGTLTFSKAALKRLRSQKAETTILKLPLEECAGKWSLPLSLKREMFSAVYQLFKEQAWDEEVFFYLCMEDESLWADVFGYEYENNEFFENAMFNFYKNKLNRH